MLIENLLDPLGVRAVEIGRTAVLALSLAAFVGQNVISPLAAIFDLSALGDFKALGGCLVGLHFRHGNLLVEISSVVEPVPKETTQLDSDKPRLSV